VRQIAVKVLDQDASVLVTSQRSQRETVTLTGIGQLARQQRSPML
jgi:hypothetical protein